MREALGRRFEVAHHPRLATILASRCTTLFPPDASLPDPYDGLVEQQPGQPLQVHDCMGISLHVEGEPWGVLTLDALEAGTFDASDRVGKELFARRLHRCSVRHAAPLVQVNCAALPESLAENELFGHVKGAFSGASGARVGRFEAAHGGALFLDEVGELPLPMQAKLLCALQEGEVQRLGEDTPRRVDVRVIAATNR